MSFATEPLAINLAGQTVLLLPEKALIIESANTMLLADVHLGKAGHFRKNGIAMPADAFLRDLEQLDCLIRRYNPDRVVYLGDLFHALPNTEWQTFSEWLPTSSTKHLLITGNHDKHFFQHALAVRLPAFQQLQLGPFTLTHEPQQSIAEGSYNLCGHVHPGVRLVGNAGAQLRLPCFWFGQQQGILPAFGYLTGAVALKGKAAVYAIADGKVFKV